MMTVNEAIECCKVTISSKENTIFINGDSPSGKTFVIHKLKALYGSQMKLYTTESFANYLISFYHISKKTFIQDITDDLREKYQIVALEDSDLLYDKDIILRDIGEIINNLSNSTTFILTGIYLPERLSVLYDVLHTNICQINLPRLSHPNCDL